MTVQKPFEANLQELSADELRQIEGGFNLNPVKAVRSVVEKAKRALNDGVSWTTSHVSRGITFYLDQKNKLTNFVNPF